MRRSILFLSFLLGSVYSTAFGTPGNPKAKDLRAVLSQKPSTAPAGGHQLSAEERAELRRQVIRLSKPAGSGS